ncbi:hypothetical protein D9613_004687 [Agrocybe pediades]|uniref:Uncharacterized protein n=1 Tax=Agrocybe pediades TaxID=84607 RepID=A0A8H4QXA8_9AGAR|nr:hypothetical protein D9613_004687 [Agrocybe pediades]
MSFDAQPTCVERLSLSDTALSNLPSNEIEVSTSTDTCAATQHSEREAVTTGPSPMNHGCPQHGDQGPTRAIHSPMREADEPPKILSVGAGLAPTPSTRLTAVLLGRVSTSSEAQSGSPECPGSLRNDGLEPTVSKEGLAPASSTPGTEETNRARQAALQPAVTFLAGGLLEARIPGAIEIWVTVRQVTRTTTPRPSAPRVGLLKTMHGTSIVFVLMNPMLPASMAVQYSVWSLYVMDLLLIRCTTLRLTLMPWTLRRFAVETRETEHMNASKHPPGIVDFIDNALILMPPLLLSFIHNLHNLQPLQIVLRYRLYSLRL